MNKRLRRHFTCPAEFAFYVLGGKWRGAIIAHLGGGPMRYSELRRVIPQLSDKMLTATVRQLESLRVVERAASRTESGPIPLYCLTPKGQALSPMLRLACAWARTHATEYGVDFMHGPPCGPGALRAEFAAIVAEATHSSDIAGARLMDS